MLKRIQSQTTVKFIRIAESLIFFTSKHDDGAFESDANERDFTIRSSQPTLCSTPFH